MRAPVVLSSIHCMRACKRVHVSAIVAFGNLALKSEQLLLLLFDLFELISMCAHVSAHMVFGRLASESEAVRRRRCRRGSLGYVDGIH